MALFTISLNQFIEAFNATPKGKSRIVKQQINVNIFLTPWYQLAKNRMKLYFRDVSQTTVLTQALLELRARVPKNDKDKRNISVSQEAITRVVGMRFENILDLGYQTISPAVKQIDINWIAININPDMIFKYQDGNKVRLGALKFHVSKSKPFDNTQSQQIANLIRMYLEQKIAKPGEVVDETIC